MRGELKPVLHALEVIRKSGTWLEIVMLLVPTLNDSPEEIRDLARWVKANLGHKGSCPACGRAILGAWS